MTMTGGSPAYFLPSPLEQELPAIPTLPPLHILPHRAAIQRHHGSDRNQRPGRLLLLHPHLQVLRPTERIVTPTGHGPHLRPRKTLRRTDSMPFERGRTLRIQTSHARPHGPNQPHSLLLRRKPTNLDLSILQELIRECLRKTP